MKIRHFAASIVFAALFATSALAGPPLVCHTFDIGDAKSLPWIGHNWNLTGNESYDTKNLPADTLGILDEQPTVLVHMETLRRAALYGAQDPVALKHLLLKLIARSDTGGSAIASFDLGYFVQVLGQVHWISKDFANPAQAMDGYGFIKKALQARPGDAQMQFAAALVTLDGPAADHEHYTKAAVMGAQSDALLARNLSAHFMSAESETMAHLLNRNSNVKVAQK